jgi:hypothetical protein
VSGRFQSVQSITRKQQTKEIFCPAGASAPLADGSIHSLEKRKTYVALHDTDAEKHGLLRIVDESGDDYLYAKTLFRPIVLPQSVRKAVLAAA